MRRSLICSAAATAALSLAASATAQTLVYNFATLYNSSGTMTPPGTDPDGFYGNGGGTTISQSTIGVPAGSYSMQFTQAANGEGFTGAETAIIPSVIDAANTDALTMDVTIPTDENFTGTFARLGVSEFGTTSSGFVAQAQTIANAEANIDLPAGTYQFTIPLIAIENPATGNTGPGGAGVPFSSIFGTTDPSAQLAPTAFEIYINMSTTSALTAYISNVEAVGPQSTGTWSSSGGGSWSNAGNWTGTGSIPQFGTDTANLNGAISANSTITLDGNISLGALNFSSTHNYTIAAGSGGTLTFDAGGSFVNAALNDSNGNHTISAPVDLNSNTVVTVTNANNTLDISGNISGIGALVVQGNGTVDLSGTNTYSGIVDNAAYPYDTTVNSGTLELGSAEALPSTGTLSIAAGGKAVLASGIGAVTMQTPVIASGGVLDINNNHVLINYGTGTDPIATIQEELASGYNGGGWNGPGIDSSAAAANGKYALGYADAADHGNPAGLSSGIIEIKYTLYGDANLDGSVNSVDFGILAANFGTSGKDWDQGAFTYNGTVNSVDFGLLAANFGTSASQAAVSVSAADWAALDAFAEANGLMSEVPEPASIGVLALGGIGLLARRRRRRT